MEQLDWFVEDPFDGNVADFPIPSEVINHASTLVDELRDMAVEINDLTADRNEIDAQMKSATSRFVIKELEESY